MTMFTPPHPGGLITEYLEDYDVSLRSLAKDLGVSPSALSKVAAGKTAISPEMALRLEVGLGIAASLWLSMQATYDLSKARETVDISHVKPSPYTQNVRPR
ncbi:HigA family addiction module antitoxin [Winslowiella iniecta]|uniref:XRE family transcriptional regulator n=1 Tax=Winslowiella iniecta TaxID=1560201 RepID=A0A0L7TGC7_9GAMM|nr:HigA family addiction module antitoxin [Winslowiella iniecta]KOC90008.1 XRE family transcriptional regulator [Winslowiella iniecta]KOC94412.1 XRE family transcriptional regulator [Winslowiella iniecta]